MSHWLSEENVNTDVHLIDLFLSLTHTQNETWSLVGHVVFLCTDDREDLFFQRKLSSESLDVINDYLATKVTSDLLDRSTSTHDVFSLFNVSAGEYY